MNTKGLIFIYGPPGERLFFCNPLGVPGKASPVVNLSEDIFAGPELHQRGREGEVGCGSTPFGSRGTFPILSRDSSFQETIKTQGKQPVFEKNDG